MQYAVIKLSGKQYQVKVGDIIETERLNFKKGDSVSFPDVLLISSDANVILGTPKVEGAYVKATVQDELKGKKIRVAKFKAKVRYRRVTGKRQSLTRLKIEEIVTKGKPTKPKRKLSRISARGKMLTRRSEATR